MIMMAMMIVVRPDEKYVSGKGGEPPQQHTSAGYGEEAPTGIMRVSSPWRTDADRLE